MKYSSDPRVEYVSLDIDEPVAFAMALIRHILFRRRVDGISAVDLGKEFGVSDSRIYELENHKKLGFNPSTRKKILAAILEQYGSLQAPALVVEDLKPSTVEQAIGQVYTDADEYGMSIENYHNHLVQSDSLVTSLQAREKFLQAELDSLRAWKKRASAVLIGLYDLTHSIPEDDG